MEKIKPTRQLMPGECLPASNYASKDDVSAAANMASCAKQTADTANDRVTALDSSLQNNVTTSHLAVDIADVTTANITTGNLSTLNANCGNLDNLTVACAASLNCVHVNCGSIDNLTTCNITMQNVNADCGDFCCFVVTDCVDARSMSACCTTAICSCAQDASICCAVIRCGNVQNLNVTNEINGCRACFDKGCFRDELHAQCGIIACAYVGELTNVISKHDLWPQDVNGTDYYVEINADNGRVMILEENKDWGVIVDNSDTNNIINISNEKNYIDKVYVDHALKPNKVYLHFTTTPSHVYYKADTISGIAPVWYSALPIDPSLATTKAYDIVEQNVVLYDKEIRIQSLDISCLDLEVNDLCVRCNAEVCGNLCTGGDICGQIIKANCYFCGNLCGSADCLGGHTFDDVICCAAGNIQSICELIPAAASCTNQLADKNWVNSSISTNTANFMGTYTDVACLPTTGVTNNDYAFVTCCDSCTGTITYDRYKWTSSDCQWHCEYSLNTSGFTADQLEAINSGITCTLVGKITDVRDSRITICQGTSCKGSFTLNQSSNCVISLDKGGLCKKQYDCAVSAERPLLMTPDSTTGDITDVYISCDKTLTFNPSTGVLTTCCFCGYVCGGSNWSKCTQSLRASNGCCTCKIELVGVLCDSDTSCYNCLYVPRCCSRLVYDICTGSLTANTFCGNLCGNISGCADDSTCFNGCTYAQACSDIRTGLTSCTGTVEFCDRGCNVNNDLPVTFKTTCSVYPGTGHDAVGASTCCSFTFNPSSGLLKTCCLCAATQVNTNTVCATNGCITNITATNISATSISGTTACAESINICGKASDTKYLITGVASAGTGKSLSVSCVACADDKPWVNFGSCQMGANYVCACCRVDAPLFCGNVSGIAATVSNSANCWMSVPWANVGTVSSGKRRGCLYVQDECESCPRLQYNPSTGVFCATCIQAGCFIGCISCARCVCVSCIVSNTQIPLVGATVGSGYYGICTSAKMPKVNACTGAITLGNSHCVNCGGVNAQLYYVNGLAYIDVCSSNRTNVCMCNIYAALCAVFSCLSPSFRCRDYRYRFGTVGYMISSTLTCGGMPISIMATDIADGFAFFNTDLRTWTCVYSSTSGSVCGISLKIGPIADS